MCDSDAHEAHIKSQLNVENAGEVFLLVSSAFHEIRCPDNYGTTQTAMTNGRIFSKNFKIYCIRLNAVRSSCLSYQCRDAAAIAAGLRCIIRIREWAFMTHFDELFHHKSLLTSLTARIVLEVIKQRMTFWNNTHRVRSKVNSVSVFLFIFDVREVHRYRIAIAT